MRTNTAVKVYFICPVIVFNIYILHNWVFPFRLVRREEVI